MGWHYGPCRPTGSKLIALVFGATVVYLIIETSKHASSVEHFFITMAIVLGAICGTCSLGVVAIFYGAHRRDRLPKVDKHAVAAEDEAIKRAREML